MKDVGIVPIEEGGFDVSRTRYDKLIEDVVSEKVCRDEGFDPEMSARVVVGKDADGDPELHVFGRSREAVDAVADGVRSPRVSLRRRYIGHNVSPEEEAGLMGVALDELVETTPRRLLPRLGEALKRLGALPPGPLGKLIEVGDEVLESTEAALADALDGFEAKFDKKGGE